jgi:hypothetical protein
MFICLQLILIEPITDCYFMRKLPQACFVCLFSLFGCKQKKISHIAPGSNIHADTIKKDLDTSLISLKSLPGVPLNDAICQLWKMDDAGQKHWNELFWDSIDNKRKFPELALYKDFSATENARCTVRFGKWKIDKNRRLLLLSFIDGTHTFYFIEKISLQKMTVVQKMGDDEVTISFSSDGLSRKQFIDDPFYPSNNQWRIKPKFPETEQKILERMKQCVHFYSLFFQDNHQRQETDISFSGLPNCFEWYNGGIGLVDKLDLDKKWLNCFYSEKEAFKGYEMLKMLIERQELNWPKNPTGWINQTHEILNQIHDKLRI